MKTIFWNVDTQYDFMREGGPHPMPATGANYFEQVAPYKGKLAIAGAEDIEQNLEKLTDLARQRQIVIVSTADWHNEKSAELSATPDFMTTFPEHCMQNTKGAEFVPATQPRKAYVVDWQDKSLDEKAVLASQELVLRKDKFDIFAGNKYADRVVQLLNPKQAIVYGVATNVCVDRAVQGLLERKVKVYVPLDAIKELPNLPLDPILDAWKNKGAVLTITNNIARYLK